MKGAKLCTSSGFFWDFPLAFESQNHHTARLRSVFFKNGHIRSAPPVTIDSHVLLTLVAIGVYENLRARNLVLCVCRPSLTRE